MRKNTACVPALMIDAASMTASLDARRECDHLLLYPFVLLRQPALLRRG